MAFRYSSSLKKQVLIKKENGKVLDDRTINKSNFSQDKKEEARPGFEKNAMGGLEIKSGVILPH